MSAVPDRPKFGSAEPFDVTHRLDHIMTLLERLIEGQEAMIALLHPVVIINTTMKPGARGEA